MTMEALHIQCTNGCNCSYVKNKVEMQSTCNRAAINEVNEVG